MVKGNECPAGGRRGAAVGVAAGMGARDRGEQGTVRSPHGILSFRSGSPPCLTGPGLSMQRQSLRDKSTGTHVSKCFQTTLFDSGTFRRQDLSSPTPPTSAPRDLGSHNLASQAQCSAPSRLSSQTPSLLREDTFVYNFELLGGP